MGTLHLQPQPKIGSIQIGLSPEAVHHYVHDWITTIEDVTPAMHHIHHLSQTSPAEAQSALPTERPYPLPPGLATHIAATTQPSRTDRSGIEKHPHPGRS